MQKLDHLKIGVLFHSIFSACQMRCTEILGAESASIIIGEALPLIEGIIEKASSEPIMAKTVEETLNNYASLLMASDIVGRINIEKKGGKYIFDVNGCIYADFVHPVLNSDKTTCIWALLGMAMVAKVSKQKVKIQTSKLTRNGSKTVIEQIKEF